LFVCFVYSAPRCQPPCPFRYSQAPPPGPPFTTGTASRLSPLASPPPDILYIAVHAAASGAAASLRPLTQCSLRRRAALSIREPPKSAAQINPREALDRVRHGADDGRGGRGGR
jgi:hypothetical protein